MSSSRAEGVYIGCTSCGKSITEQYEINFFDWELKPNERIIKQCVVCKDCLEDVYEYVTKRIYGHTRDDPKLV